MNRRKFPLCLNIPFALAVAFGALSCSNQDQSAQDEALYRSVNPFIGTDWVGNTYPGANAPHGMVQLSPDNGLPGWDRIAGYFYPDSTIAGFSHTHLSGTGAGDMYDISFLPVIGRGLIDTTSALGLHAKFSHENEEAWAGYYAVRLDPYNIKVELTATERTGIQRYTFGTASDSAVVVLNLGKAMNWDKTLATGLAVVQASEQTGFELEGYRYSDGWARNQRVYFATSISRRPERVRIDSIPLFATDDKTARPIGYGYTAHLHYKVKQGDTLVIKTALSGVDTQGAWRNMREEANHFDFDRYRRACEEAWQQRLGRIRIEGASEDERKVFYTALYRAHLCPTLYSDVDSRYLGADRVVRQLPNGEKHYSTFSLWDTYRATHPLYNIVAPELNRQMVQSLIDFGKQNQGHLPIWNMWASETDMMIGYHSVPVIVEAILRGVYTPQSHEELTALFRSTAERSGYRGLDEYRTLGYVPADKYAESLSLTLEYAYDDAAIAAWAKHSGDSILYREYTARASNYRNVWDGTSGFFRPRLSDGSFLAPFNPFDYSMHITESNAYHYLMSVQHDPIGLVRLMGGEAGLAGRLDEFFTTVTPDSIDLPIFSTGMIGQYAHGNEPSHHTIFLYNVARQPWKTADYTRIVCQEFYTNRPDGLCGNEDCGQMSAWYIFASLGFYPLDPLTGRYELTAPRFPRSEINVGGKKPFVIEAKGLSPEKRYIRRVLIDGQQWRQSYITYEQIMRGAHVTLEMTDQVGVCWY